MSIITQLQYTIDDYFEVEMASELRHEYLDGEISVMVGGSQAHSLILGNIYRILLNGLASSEYRVCCGNTRVKILASNAYLCPDAVVSIGQGEYEHDRLDTLLNPSVIFEVLSHSTVKFDRGEKFELYRQVDSLKEYILVAQDRPSVEQRVRNLDETWNETHYESFSDQLVLRSMQCSLSLETIYDLVDLPF